MANIDTLTAKARNYLKKTGDAMISGFLTLFQDPTLAMHAVTKQYVDNLVAASAFFNWMQMPIVGSEYYPPWGSAGAATYGIPLNLSIIAPFYSDVGLSFDQIGVYTGNANSATIRYTIYNLNPNTWLPTSIALDCGTFTWPGVGGTLYKAIAYTTTQKTWGVAAYYESTAGAAPLLGTVNLASVGVWPPGADTSIGTLILPRYKRIQSTTGVPGAPPPVASYSLTAVAGTTGAQIQPLVTLRRV